MIDLDDIRKAREALAGELPVTPTVPAPRLSRQLGADLWLKLENQHYTGSFKERGALNKLKHLPAGEAKAGVIAMSAGNHAQGVAFHANRLGIPATIVMPKGTPFTKVERTEAYGARVLLHGENLSEAEAFARETASKEGLGFVHPYDDPLIIAGQGTIGLEILEAAPDVDTVVVPIGGGGLISGIATAVKALRPGIRVIGVQSALYPSMYQVLRGEEPKCGGASVAEGIAVKAPGRIPREIIGRLVDEILLVDETTLERAVDVLATVQKQVVEGAGAAGIAAMIAHPDRFAGRKVAVVLCGGNIDPRVLASILMRGLVRDGRVVQLRIEITDSPGVLGKVAALLGEAGANIIEVYHKRLFHNVPVKMAEIDVVLETRDRTHVDAVIAKLAEAGFPTSLLSEVS